ncbi:MAG: hypothetical protein ACPGU1_16015 [Myxococcota bacterium]
MKCDTSSILILACLLLFSGPALAQEPESLDEIAPTTPGVKAPAPDSDTNSAEPAPLPKEATTSEPNAAPEEQEEDAAEVSPWQPPRHRLLYRNRLVARINPSGLQNGFELAFHYRLFDSDSVLFRDSYVGVAVKPMISPAFTRLGISAQAQPLAVLYLEASWNWMMWYGVLGHPRTYPDASGDYSDTGVADAAEALGDPSAASGWELDLIAELRAKVGPLVIRNRFTMMRSELSSAEPVSDSLFYDPLYDLLRPRSGWSLMNDADVLVYLLDEHLIVGARHTMAMALWPGEMGSETTHRLGPLVAYRFFMEPGAAFDAPTAFTLVQWHLDHPHRTGQDVSQAIPYIVLGFAFQGDLL